MRDGERADRIPPGQGVTPGWPVLHVGFVPEQARENFTLRVGGEVERSVELDWNALLALPQSEVLADFHCVTGWSRLENRWSGVLLRDLASVVRPRARATYVRFADAGFYDTGVPLEVALESQSILAHGHDGALLSPEHGGPLRAVVPSRYGWKSCKWVREVEFLEEERLGFWELRGYHRVGDPWREERLV